MTRELIIEGQHVDLAPDTDITLEYVSNLIGDVGKINLSHSYTAKLPKTAQNARILDDPGRPGHESSRTRRFLSAQYYRNGINLIGQAQAYLLRATPDSYEVALVWNTLEALQVLSQNPETLNDLPNLPMLTWIGQNGRTPDYFGGTDGAFFAWYDAGLGPNLYPTVNAGTHPSMGPTALIERILNNAGVPFNISDAARAALSGHAILAAPGHNPSRLQEMESGSSKYSGVAFDGTLTPNGGSLVFDDYAPSPEWVDGWDPTQGMTTSGQVFFKGDNDQHRILLNLKAPAGVNLYGSHIAVRAATYTEGGAVDTYEDLLELYFKFDGASYYVSADEQIKVSSWPNYYLTLGGENIPNTFVEFSAYDPALPLIASNRVHDTIDIANDNRFPLQGNLPDIKQWDFIKACMAQFGLAPIIQDGALSLYTYDELLTARNAYDWTGKVDMSNADPEDMSYTLDSWAQENIIAFQEDAPLAFDPNAALVIQDTTLAESRDLYELPWAASMQSAAQHYKVKDDGALEDVDIQPRIFAVGLGLKGQTLRFDDSMQGEGLIEAHYKALQEVVRNPVRITANIRLHEIDLAQLDLTRPVYLGQYGQYYAILKIQTSATDLCKVELLQLP